MVEMMGYEDENDVALVVYVRHGLSLFNVVCGDRRWLPNEEAKRRISHLSENATPLADPEGYEQAREAGRQLRTLIPGGFDVAFHSDAVRTEQTLHALLAAAAWEHTIPTVQTHLLNERHSGALFRMTEEDMNRYFGWYPEYHEREGWFRAEPPGGESIERVMLRIREFRRMLRRSFSGRRVLIAGHGTYGLGWRVDVEGQPTDTLELPFRYIGNCEFLVYVYNGASKRLVLHADCSTAAD